jgi:hypothetical protein
MLFMVSDGQVWRGQSSAGDKEAQGGAADQRLVDGVAPLGVTARHNTPEERRVSALMRRAARLRRESVQLRERAAALGFSPVSGGTRPCRETIEVPVERIEALRRALLSARARIRALDARAQAGPLPATAAAKLGALRVEAARLWEALRRISREDIPADPD